MHKSLLTPALLVFCLIILGAEHTRADEKNGDVRALPLSMTTQVDAGQIVKGHIGDINVDDPNLKGNNRFLQRTSVWLTQEVVIRERLDVKVGVGGMFWYALPAGEPGGGDGGAASAFTKFGPGIGRADMTYRFGSLEKPMFTLQAGFFPYKYNPEAMNLGEYLLRSGTYPGYLVTGGWNIVSHAGYMMQGIRLNLSLWNDRFQSEFLLPVERDLPPTGDLSPSYIASLVPVRGIEIGGGVSCHHCIAVKPSVTSPKVRYNPNAPDFLTVGNGSGYVIDNPAYVDTLPPTDITGSNPRYVYDSTQFYTFQGVKLMARFSVDPKAYVPMPMLGSQDLKVFGEVALLGVKDYPFYYEKKTERMPFMLGLNLPTFKLIDAFSFQMEYYDSPFLNSTQNVYFYQMPTLPFVDSTGTTKTDPNSFDRKNAAVTRDNWKWSLYARKEVIKGLRFYAQVANDHLRVPDYTAKTTYRPITDRNGKDWYYLVRFELGI